MKKSSWAAWCGCSKLCESRHLTMSRHGGKSKMEPEKNKERQIFCLENETDIAVYQVFMSYKGVLAQGHLSAFTKYACLALQGEFLLNATVGIAAFSEQENGKIAVAFCAIGAILAIASSFLAYISQRFFFEHDTFYLDSYIRKYFQISYPEPEKAYFWIKLKSRTSLLLTIGTSVASLICFVCGLCKIL